MKLLAISLYVMVLVMAVSAQNVQSTPGPFSISISSPDTQVTLGDKVRIEIVLENISDKEITVAQSNSAHKGELSYVISAVSTTGVSVPLTEYGKALNGLPTQAPVAIRDNQKPHFLQPHEKVTAEVTLNRIYKFVTPGKFFIQAAKDINPDTANSGVVKSNILTLTVVQNNTSQQ